MNSRLSWDYRYSAGKGGVIIILNATHLLITEIQEVEVEARCSSQMVKVLHQLILCVILIYAPSFSVQATVHSRG